MWVIRNCKSGQTIQWSKERKQNDKQCSTRNHTPIEHEVHKKPGPGEHRHSGWVALPTSLSSICRVIVVINLVIRHVKGQDEGLILRKMEHLHDPVFVKM